ncbi:hypothetical protein J6S88_05420 [bacterium]|nr:hypothetical protein [bacterium]
MDIRISPVNFEGMWEPVKVFHATNGFKPRTRQHTNYTLHDMVYHPFKNETAEEIAKVVKKFFKGRTFTGVDIQEGQHIGDYYQFNRVKVGEAIDEKDIQKYLDMGYTKEMHGGISSKKDFWDAMRNDSFGAMDYMELTIERIEEIIAKVFKKTAG